MPPSETDKSTESMPGLALAIAAESLFLANLLLIPGLGFLVLAVLFFKYHKNTAPLALCHLEQTFYASLWGGVLLVVINLLILLLGGYQGAYTWMIVILYFTICHSSLILIGMFGLAKAMAGKCFKYPLIGKALPSGCGDMM